MFGFFFKLSRSFSVKLLSVGRAAMIRKCHVQLGATYDERVPRGVEGVGKSTNIKFISSYMESKNIKYLCTREPGGTVNAEKIRDILLHSEEEKVPEIVSVRN